MAKMGGFKEFKLPKNRREEVKIVMGFPLLALDVDITIPKDPIRFDSRGWINKAVKQGTLELQGELGAALDAAMSSSGWGWGEDIVDTGALKASRQITASGSSLQISYSEPYAGLVHYGGYIVPYGNQAAQPVYVPGRPWIEATINGDGPISGIDYMEVYYRALANGLK